MRGFAVLLTLVLSSAGGCGQTVQNAAALRSSPNSPLAATSAPIISRNVPAYDVHEINPPSQAVNATYSDTAACTPPCYVALDLSGAGALGKVWVTWYNIANNFDYTVMGDASYGLPSTYSLDANAAAGGTLPTSGWVSLASATGEHFNAREFALDLSGYHWLRMNVTVVAGSPGNTDAAFQLDVSTSNDGWLFGGDSITSDGMTQDETYGGALSPPKPNFAEQVNAAVASKFPLQIDAGIGGITATAVAGTYTLAGSKCSSCTDLMKGWLTKFDGQFVTLNYGTNDAAGEPVTDYYNAMSILVRDVLAAGKVPIVPTIPWACDRDVTPYNVQVANLYAAFPQVVRGPDLYSLWLNSADIRGNDCLHPSYPNGMSVYRQQWAQWAIANIYGSQSSRPTVASITPTSGPVAGGTSVTITGTNLSGATAVEFGSVAASSFTVDSATQITATSPAGALGTVDVTVTGPGGTSATGPGDRFTYVRGTCSSATLSADKVAPQAGGTLVTFTAVGAGPGCSSPLYEFWTWSVAGGWQMRQGYSTKAQFGLNTSGMAPGTYTVDVWVEESGSVLGSGGYESFGLESWVVGGCDYAGLTPNPAASSGSDLFTASAGGAGCGTPQYQFWIYSTAGGWQLKQAYSASNSWSLDTGTLAAGTYSVDVWVKQQGSPLQYETWALSTIAKGACGSGTTTTTITSTQLTPQAVGGTVSLSTLSTCGTSPSYRYWSFPGQSNSWQMLRDYSPTGSYAWNTSGYQPGTQSLDVHVAKAAPGAAPDTWGLLSYSLLGCAAAGLSASPASPQAHNGGAILFTATAASCPAADYQFWYLGPGGSWTKARDWGSTASYSWNPAAFAPGTYAWVVYVRQHGSAGAYDSYALTSFTVT